MPLSEYERGQLDSIATLLAATDPGLAARMSTTLSARQRRTNRFAVSLTVAVLGVVVIVAGAIATASAVPVGTFLVLAGGALLVLAALIVRQSLPDRGMCTF